MLIPGEFSSSPSMLGGKMELNRFLFLPLLQAQHPVRFGVGNWEVPRFDSWNVATMACSRKVAAAESRVFIFML